MSRLEFTHTDQIRTANAQNGGYFFAPDTLRFFRSRVHAEVYGGRYFVTSEQFDDESDRLFAVRVVLDDYTIDTVGEFQQYASRSGAHAAARRYAEEWTDGEG